MGIWDVVTNTKRENSFWGTFTVVARSADSAIVKVRRIFKRDGYRGLVIVSVVRSKILD